MTGEEELDRVRATGDDGSWLTAVEVRLVEFRSTRKGPRRVLGRCAWHLNTDEALDLVDKGTFIVRANGEMLTRA